MGMPWIVAGDFNVEPAVIEKVCAELSVPAVVLSPAASVRESLGLRAIHCMIVHPALAVF